MKRNNLLNLRKAILQLIFCVIIILFMYPLMNQMMQVSVSDLYLHAEFADMIYLSIPSTWFNPIAHPLWHFCVRLLRFIGMSFEHAGVVFTIFTKIAEFLIVNCFYDRMLSKKISYFWIPVLSFITLTVSAICIPSINPHVYLNAGTPNTWHSPTQILMSFWILASVFLLSTSYERQLQLSGSDCDLTWKKVCAFSMCLVACLLSKPVFILGFFPAASLYFLFQWIRHPNYSRYYVRLLVSLIPTLLFVILPANTYFGPDTESSIQIIADKDMIVSALRTSLLTNAFPFVILLANIRKQKDSMTSLALYSHIFTSLLYAFFCETGSRASHGNFIWGLLGSSLLLWVIAVPKYVEMILESNTKPKKYINIICGVLLAWHFISGIYYLYYLNTSGMWY